MRDLGQVWKDCHDGTVEFGNWEYERKVVINGREFLDDEIISVTIDRSILHNGFSIGNCISGMLKATLAPKTAIVGRRGNIEYYLRVRTADGNYSDWNIFGTYRLAFVTEEEKRTSITAYDALSDGIADLKMDTGGTTFLGKLSAKQVVSEVTRGWLEMESEDQFNPGIKIDVFPPGLIEYDEQGKLKSRKYLFKEFKVREILSMVAALHGGNFCISESGKLKLVVPKTGSPVARVTKANSKRIAYGGSINFTGLSARYGDERKQVYIAGEDGEILYTYNPLATEGSTNIAFNKLSNMTYNSFFITSTEIDPAVELGDVISVDGKLTNVWNLELTNRIYLNMNIPNDIDNYDYIQNDTPIRTCTYTSLVPQTDWTSVPSGTGSSLGYRYKGPEKCLMINAQRSFAHMFQDSDIQKVVLIEPDVTENNRNNPMKSMFLRSNSPKLDLTEFNTSGVKKMNRMFESSKAEELDLRSFDTTSVSDFSWMFHLSEAKHIDISSFSIGNSGGGVKAEWTQAMFAGSKASSIKMPYVSTFGDYGNPFSSGTFYMDNLKHLVMNRATFPIGSGDYIFSNIRNLEALDIKDVVFQVYQGDTKRITSSNSKLKYIDIRNVLLSTEASSSSRLRIEAQQEMIVNMSGNCSFRGDSSDVTKAVAYNTRFLPNKHYSNSLGKMTVLCNQGNIVHAMNVYMRAYMAVDATLDSPEWADHDIEFKVDEEFEWDYEQYLV